MFFLYIYLFCHVTLMDAVFWSVILLVYLLFNATRALSQFSSTKKHSFFTTQIMIMYGYKRKITYMKKFTSPLFSHQILLASRKFLQIYKCKFAYKNVATWYTLRYKK